MVFKTKMRNVSQTPRKAGEVAAMIRCRSIDDALVILQHTPRRAALFFIKLLKNARAAAIDNHRLNVRSLQVEEIFVVSGPVFKGQRRNAKLTTSKGAANRHGSGAMIVPWNRRTSHIFLTVKGEPSKSVVSKSKQDQKTEAEKGVGDGSES